ncbi:unnamed protein product [Paramecium pentaurelia]|uniref:DNA/RNA-binding protein Alba-like domain-containing protein n=1 Tax=Paramecium pentaurelia TaxID=43138 RepID=A0A8S1TNU5_9CILI|nr:unnamed protein product [Paramecium pentaurelia]
MQKDPFDIMIKGKSTQDQIASYLVKVVLGLRDKENTQKSVKLLGSGAAIPHAILVAEIIRSRIKGVNSITQFESMEKDIQDQDNKEQSFHLFIPAIRITLTMNPTEEEKLMPGFQIQNEVGDDKNIELFDYVMMYIRNLYYWKGKAKEGKDNDHRNYKQIKSNQDDKFDRRQENTKNYQQTKQSYANPDKSENWNKDRNQFQQTQNQRNLMTRGNIRSNRNDRDGQPPRVKNQYVEKNQDTKDQQREERVIRQGEVRTRGGSQRTQH